MTPPRRAPTDGAPAGPGLPPSRAPPLSCARGHTRSAHWVSMAPLASSAPPPNRRAGARARANRRLDRRRPRARARAERSRRGRRCQVGVRRLAARAPADGRPWHRTGSLVRLAELAAVLDVAPGYLHACGRTARSWPPATRVPAASWDCHLKFCDGGPAKAEWRRDILLSLPRDRSRRVTSGGLRAWRRAQASEHAATSTRAYQPRARARRGDRRARRQDRPRHPHRAPESLWAVFVPCGPRARRDGDARVCTASRADHRPQRGSGALNFAGPAGSSDGRCHASRHRGGARSRPTCSRSGRPASAPGRSADAWACDRPTRSPPSRSATMPAGSPDGSTTRAARRAAKRIRSGWLGSDVWSPHVTRRWIRSGSPARSSRTPGPIDASRE